MSLQINCSKRANGSVYINFLFDTKEEMDQFGDWTTKIPILLIGDNHYLIEHNNSLYKIEGTKCFDLLQTTKPPHYIELTFKGSSDLFVSPLHNGDVG